MNDEGTKPPQRWPSTLRAAARGARFGAILAGTLVFLCVSAPLIIQFLIQEGLVWQFLLIVVGIPAAVGLIGAVVSATLHALAAALSHYPPAESPPATSSTANSEPPQPKTDAERSQLLHRLSGSNSPRG